eukprot:9396498-Karenia_brevis.AAC.1
MVFTLSLVVREQYRKKWTRQANTRLQSLRPAITCSMQLLVCSAVLRIKFGSLRCRKAWWTEQKVEPAYLGPLTDMIDKALTRPHFNHAYRTTSAINVAPHGLFDPMGFETMHCKSLL